MPNNIMEESMNDSISHVSAVTEKDSKENCMPLYINGDEEQEHYNHCAMKGQYEFEAITPEASCKNAPDDSTQNGESSAVDLTTTRVPFAHHEKSPKVFWHNNRHKKDMLSIADLLETFYYNDSNISSNPSSKFLVVNPVENMDCLVLNGDNIINKSGSLTETASNTDLVSMVDRESQTIAQSTQEAAVQADVACEPKTYAPSLTKSKDETQEKYTCLICQRFYSSKCSYDRHVRTHTKIVNRKVMNVRLTTEAKLQIYKKSTGNRQTNVKPIIIKVPQTTAFQCNLCKQNFPTQIRRDRHRNYCIVEPFPLLKCKECHTDFFTKGAVRDHISLMHKNYLPETNVYCCVFCNERFDNSYIFQLHLDKHLSP